MAWTALIANFEATAQLRKLLVLIFAWLSILALFHSSFARGQSAND